MKLPLRTLAIATSSVAIATLLSLGGLSLSINKAEAATRVYITTPYGRGGYARNEGVSWYAVRAYYWGGPWSGYGWSYAGWDDYASRYGIGCRPGTIVKGGDGIDYLCQ
jgi:hypothetical protein